MRHLCFHLHAVSCVTLIWITAGSSDAAIVTYTSSGAFDVALAGRVQASEHFDTSAAGTLIPTGSRFGGITFSYNWASGESLRINDSANTASGSNYLGATNGTGTPVDLVADGNNLSMAPNLSVSALGLFVITSDPAFDGDLTLSTTGGHVSLTRADMQGSLADNSEIYFLGLVEDSGAALGPFELTASIAAGAAQLGYRLDGITYAETTGVPEPNSLFGLCLLAASGTARRTRRAR